MFADDAYSLLEAISEINDCTGKLNKVSLTDEDKAAEEAEEIATETQEKAENFSFSKCHIPLGAAVLEYCNDPNVKCTVNERMVEYQGKEYI